jgi:hypothetical protein
MLGTKLAMIPQLSLELVQKKLSLEFVAFLQSMVPTPCSTLIPYRIWLISSVQQQSIFIPTHIFKRGHFVKCQILYLLVQMTSMRNVFFMNVYRFPNLRECSRSTSNKQKLLYIFF